MSNTPVEDWVKFPRTVSVPGEFPGADDAVVVQIAGEDAVAAEKAALRDRGIGAGDRAIDKEGALVDQRVAGVGVSAREYERPRAIHRDAARAGDLSREGEIVRAGRVVDHG